MTGFTGTWRLFRLAVRRDRVVGTAWVLGLFAFVLSQAASIVSLYPTQADLDRLQTLVDIEKREGTTQEFGLGIDPEATSTRMPPMDDMRTVVTGMDARELQTFITALDWDQLFEASTFAFKNIRRKTDARAYPSRLEFGLRGGIVPPTALNSGQQVELLLGRIAAPYFNVEDFDDLPTPFRTVAVDLLSAQPVVMRRGSLADAMRATMSLPLIFPPGWKK